MHPPWEEGLETEGKNNQWHFHLLPFIHNTPQIHRSPWLPKIPTVECLIQCKHASGLTINPGPPSPYTTLEWTWQSCHLQADAATWAPRLVHEESFCKLERVPSPRYPREIQLHRMNSLVRLLWLWSRKQTGRGREWCGDQLGGPCSHPGEIGR